MSVFERMTDARCGLGGKAISVTLSVLLALSSLNLSVLPQRAVADEIDAAQALAVNDKVADGSEESAGVDQDVADQDVAADFTMPDPSDADADAPAVDTESDGSPDGIGGPASPEPEGADAADAPGEVLGGEDAAEINGASDPEGADDVASSEESATEASPLTTTSLQAEANDGTRVSVATSAAAGFPAGSQLRVETALSQEVTAAIQASLGAGERLAAHTAYKIEVLNADGSLLANAGELTVSVENPSIAPLGITVFRLVGNGNAQQVQGALELVPDPTSLTFVTTAVSSVYAFAVIEESSVGDEGEQPPADDEGDGAMTAPGDDDGAPEPGQPGDGDGPAVVESLELYAGEARAVTCIAGHNHSWVTDDASIVSLANVNAATVSMRAEAVGTTTVRCDDQALFVVTVKPAPITEAVTHFYFLPPTSDGSAASTASAKYLGSGLVRVPAGYESHSQLVNGSVLASSTDAAGNPVSNKVVSLRDLIVEAPSDKEIRTGLAAYYRGTLDGAQAGETSRLKYDDSWTYTYEPVLFEGEKLSAGYNGSSLEPASAYHMYVTLKVTTPDSYTMAYEVRTPTGTETRSVMHNVVDEPIALNGLEEGSSSIVVDGIQYHASKTVEGGTRYLFDGWYTDPAFRTKAPAAYDGAASATFYARYVAEDAPTVSFDAAGGTFANGTCAPQSLRVSTGDSYWLPEAPERFGYEFAGWKADGVDALNAAGSGRKMGTSDVSYTAVWTPAAASIVFDAGEGSFGEGATAEFSGVTGAALDDRAMPTPVLPGYRFAGWYAGADLAGAPIISLPSVFPAGRTTYYARYEVDPAQRYTVTYMVDPQNVAAGYLERGLTVGATGAPLYDRDLLLGSVSGVRGAVAHANPGYQFTGWFKMLGTAGDAGEEQVTDALEPELTPEAAAAAVNGTAEEGFADTVFVARFDFTGPMGKTHDYRIEYFLMGDDGVYAGEPTCVRTLRGYDYTKVQLSERDETYDLAGITGVPLDYIAENYLVDRDAPGSVREGILEPEGDVTLRVYLQKRLAVTFNAGDRGVIESDSVAADGLLSDDGTTATYRRLLGESMPAAPSVEPAAGYRFAGWFEGDVSADELLAAPAARALACTARYEALPASISFVENGGSSVDGIAGVTGEPLASVAMPATERAGYTFAGWYDNEACLGDAVAALPATMPAGDTVYYAQWEANPARIIFDANAADVEGSVPVGLHGVTDGAVAVAFPTTVNLQRDGYTFAGWNTAADGSGNSVEAFPATFPMGDTVYYAQWKLDVTGLTAADFSYKGIYDGRAHRIALPASVMLKEGEHLAMLVDGAWVSDPARFPAFSNVADSAAGLTVGILSAAGDVLFRTDEVSVDIQPAPLHVVTGSVVQPFNGSPATNEQIAVTGLVMGETLGARTTGAATEVGQEVPNTFELTWAAAGNDYTAREGNYEVSADLGTIRMVTAECPVTITGYVGIYDGDEHAIVWEASEAEVVFDAPLSYADAGLHEVGYTVTCPDHGTYTGTVAVSILARDVTIQVEDSFKVAGTVDPVFRGAIVDGELVSDGDLGDISFGRTFEGEEVGMYVGALTALFEPNANYAVVVLPGTFTIGPAGTTVVPSQNPLLPPRTPSGPGAPGAVPIMPEGAGSAVVNAVADVMEVRGASAVSENAGVAAPAAAGVAAAIEVLADDETPLASTASFDDGAPTITRLGGEVIEDDATALGAFDEPHCWVHWLMVIGVLLTLLFALVALGRRRAHTQRLESFEAAVAAPRLVHLPEAGFVRADAVNKPQLP